MPRANPERSFEASARHLFRHINDENALRNNPLVRSYFRLENEEPEGILEAIRAELRALTDAICDDLRSKGRQLQARRRCEIVAALCAGKTPAETATDLRISRSHYYRERQIICSRVAAALRQSAATRDSRLAVSDDPLRLLLRRAESLRDGGFCNEAVGLLADGYSRVDHETVKFALGFALAEELVFLGHRDRAAAILARADDSKSQREGNGASEWLADTLALNKARLASQLNGSAAAGSALERFAKRRAGERRADDVTFDAVFLAGEWYRNAGRYDEARKMLHHLRRMQRESSRALAKRHIAIALMEGYCSEASSDEFGVAERSLREALDLSVASGTLIGALLATSGLVHHEAARGHDDAVYAMAHEALRMAEGADFAGFLGYVVAEITDALLGTRYWRATAPLVFDAERLVVPGTMRHALIKRGQGRYFMKIAQMDKAREATLAAYRIASALGSGRLEGLILRDRALMLSGEKNLLRRAEFMREAVELVERFGSAAELTETYEYAARVLPDRRIQRLAHHSDTVTGREEGNTVRHHTYARQVEPLTLPRISAPRPG